MRQDQIDQRWQTARRAPLPYLSLHLLTRLAEPNDLLHTGFGGRRHRIKNGDQPDRSLLCPTAFSRNGSQTNIEPWQMRRNFATCPQTRSDELPANRMLSLQRFDSLLGVE